MKYSVQQQVTVVPLGKKGVIVHRFPFKVYGLPDSNHYTVKLPTGEVYECTEEELSV